MMIVDDGAEEEIVQEAARARNTEAMTSLFTQLASEDVSHFSADNVWTDWLTL